jgi:carboxymethylenebutenolidase
MNLFQRYLVEEYAEDYQDGIIPKTEALHLIASFYGSVAAAEDFLASYASPKAAPGNHIKAKSPNRPNRIPPIPEDPDATGLESEHRTAYQGKHAIHAEDMQYPGEGASIHAYQAQPSGEGRYPVILICHENRGLTEHIKDVTRRFAHAGYAALAVDLLSRHGGTQALDYSEVPSILGNIDPDQFVKDFIRAWHHISQQPFALGDQVGMTGFCFGGGVTWRVATHMPELRAAVPFYGPHPPVSDVASIRAAILAMYAGNDQRINQGIPVIEEEIQRLHKPYAKVIYPETDHAFFNDTGPRYNPEAAKDAWNRTLNWFERHLEREGSGG